MAAAGTDDAIDLVELTAGIVSAHVAGNTVATSDVASLIRSVHATLAQLGKAPEASEAEKPKGAVSARESIKPDGLISMIDGKKYQTLRRHIARHGYTPQSYRAAFGLPDDYPMTSAAYSERRRVIAVDRGLGRRVALTAAVSAAAVATAAVIAAPDAKATRKRHGAKTGSVDTEAPMALVEAARSTGSSSMSPPSDDAVAQTVTALAAQARRKPLKLNFNSTPNPAAEIEPGKPASDADDFFDLAKG